MTKTVTVASVDGGYITTDAAANFANQQAIVKFMLKDANGNDLKASSLTIAAASNRQLKGKLNLIDEWTTIATVTIDTWSDLTSYAGTMLKVLPPAYALGGKLTSLLV